MNGIALQALKEAGWNVVQIPVLNFQFLGIPELQSALFRPEQYSGLILTTPRAVEALLLAVKSDDKGIKNLDYFTHPLIFMIFLLFSFFILFIQRFCCVFRVERSVFENMEL